MPRPIKPAKTPALAAAESEVQRFLAARDFLGAVRAMVAYEVKQPAARGMGIDWTTYDGRSQVAGLTSIFAATAPDIVRLAAAQMYLWGVSRPYRRWLGAEVGGDAQATTLVLAAFKAQQAFSNADANRRFGFSLPETL